jgi:hypothetical protein
MRQFGGINFASKIASFFVVLLFPFHRSGILFQCVQRFLSFFILYPFERVGVANLSPLFPRIF